MKVIPAIDLINGQVVRLSRGDPNTAKVYDYLGTPVEVALKWKSQGAERLHLIDLDATFKRGNNLDVVEEIAKATALPIQVGGGIHSFETIERLLKSGINYVILGVLAFSEPSVVTRVQKKFGSEPLIVALDNKDGKVMVSGWQTPTSFTVNQALEKFSKMGVKTFLITSIAKDGMLEGPDLETLHQACQNQDLNIIAAGGISNLKDLVALKNVGVAGAVVGKAIYEGRFTLTEAIKTVKEA
ncbi:MAG: 1-(5-phosphoribosyl)-5-[(5-phosphoribosylamino)methylideneamino]imidazole-4-carboxamide isomerase [Candidatus Bathyarchaeota archaeon]|nr:1-(5-phosphoribosyl)-5-[(5-phosphoribosylamino)methylideneamino]imidazole-4-carboxamide isomerase [Candidatus Bathyarchaeota archaeon]